MKDETRFRKLQTSERGTDFERVLGLSQGDLHALRCLYVYDPVTFAATCQSDYDPLKRGVPGLAQ